MTVRILTGDCREVLRTLPDESIHMVCTSPPYYGLRDYQTAKWEGGDPGCDHKERTARNDGGRTQIGAFNGSARADSDKGGMNFRHECGKCGARRIDSQIGLEPTPSCNRHGMLRLRSDLTETQREFVVRTLLGGGLRDV